MKTETQTKKEIAAYLDSLGEKCWHTAFHNVGYGRKGIPDRIVCYRGFFFAIEVKRDEGATATAWQQREIDAIHKAQGYACVVWSVRQVRNVISQIDVAAGLNVL